ncbi:MAG TPA: S8 family peptidase [Candidatus Kapabacteria bacterium]|nr:S8 family peptidase [Candidatus Kapabacteria bacterium]
MIRFSAISLFAAGTLALSISACTDSPLSAPSDNPVPTEGTHARLVAPAPGASTIEDSYIVVFRDDATLDRPGSLMKTAAGIEHQYPDIDIETTFQHSFKGFSARIPEARLRTLLNDPRIAYIEPDQVVNVCSTSTVQTLDWGTSYVGADSSSTVSGDNANAVTGVEVFVIDTGIDPDHDDLNVVGGINYGNQLKDSTHWYDEHGHGTHVAGILGARDNGAWTVGVAPGVPMYSVRVFGPMGSGSSTSVIKGMEWVRRQRLARPNTDMVANMSLICSASLSFDRSVKALVASGVTVVVAAGNSSTLASSYSPARVPEVLTIAASTSTGTLATFSNYGSAVDLIAPGVSILSSKMGGGVKLLSGTSMATPQVAGAAALYLSRNGGSSPAQVASALIAGAPAWGVSLPTGTPNRMLRVTGL